MLLVVEEPPVGEEPPIGESSLPRPVISQSAVITLEEHSATTGSQRIIKVTRQVCLFHHWRTRTHHIQLMLTRF